MPILLIVSAPGPLLVKVTFCAALVVFTVWLPKLRLAADRPTTGATPVPLKVTACGMPLPLSVMLSAAPRLPVAVGVNVTLIVQLALSALVAVLTGQLLVCALLPYTTLFRSILLIVSAPGPLLVKVTFCAALVVFTVWLPKLRLAADRPTTGAT